MTMAVHTSKGNRATKNCTLFRTVGFVETSSGFGNAVLVVVSGGPCSFGCFIAPFEGGIMVDGTITLVSVGEASGGGKMCDFHTAMPIKSAKTTITPEK